MNEGISDMIMILLEKYETSWMLPSNGRIEIDKRDFDMFYAIAEGFLSEINKEST